MLFEATGIADILELANRLGVSAPYVNKRMKGETNFTIESLAKIAHALNTEFKVSLLKD